MMADTTEGSKQSETGGSEAFTKPPMPEIVVTALREGVEYVDATQLLTATLEHLRRVDAFVTTVGVALAGVQQSLIRQGSKLVELEADMAAEGIGGADGGQSGIILNEQPGLVGLKKGH